MSVTTKSRALRQRALDEYLQSGGLMYQTRKLYGKSLTNYSTKSSERLLSKKSYAADMAFISDREDVVTSQNLGWRLENVVLLELAL